MHRCSGGDDVALLTFVDFCGFRKQTKQCKCLVATRLAGLAGKGGAGQGSKQKRDASCPIVGFRVLACQVINWLARGGWSPMGGWVCVRNQRQTADSSQPLRLHFSSSTHPHHESRSNPIPHSTFSNQQPAYYRLSPRVLEYIFATFGARDCALAARFVVFCAFPAKQSSSSSPVASRSHLAITQHLATNLAAPERGSLSVALSASFGALFAGRKRGIGQSEIWLWENGGHNGAAGSNNTFFLHTNFDNPNTARPASRVFRFLRALFFAQIYSHRAPGYQPDTFTGTLAARPFCAPTRKLARFP